MQPKGQEMSKLTELRQRKQELRAQAEAINGRVDANGDLSDADAQAFEATLADIRKVDAAIKREETLQEVVRETAAATFRAAEPEPKKTAADERRFASFGEQLQAIATAGMNRSNVGSGVDSRLIYSAAAGLNEAVPSEGGFLVQTDFSMALLAAMNETGEIYSRVRNIPIAPASNGIKLPQVDETSRANGSRWGGVQAYWANEADTVTATKPKFRQVEMSLRKLFGLGYATDELLADATALEAVMTQAFTEELIFKTEDAFVNGTGDSQPLGWLNSGALVTVSAEGGQTSGTIVTANILKMWARLPPRSRRNAVWYVNQDIEPQLYQLTLGSGTAVQLLYVPPGTQGGNPYGLLMGRPVIPVEYAATLGTVGDIQLVDPTQYLAIDKGGPTSASSMHVRFIYDEMTFRFIFRVDGQPAWRSPVTPFKGSNTQSPFVALAAR